MKDPLEPGIPLLMKDHLAGSVSKNDNELSEKIKKQAGERQYLLIHTTIKASEIVKNYKPAKKKNIHTGIDITFYPDEDEKILMGKDLQNYLEQSHKKNRRNNNAK